MKRSYGDFKVIVRYVEGDPEELDIALNILAGIIADAYLRERPERYRESDQKKTAYRDYREGDY